MSTLVSIGIVILLLGGGWNMAVISPGELIAAHSAIQPAVTGAKNCALCHLAADDSPQNWVTAAFTSGTELLASKKCLTCHFPPKNDFLALFVHSVDRDRLGERLNVATQQRPSWRSVKLALASLTGPPPPSAQGEIPCATCHQEHHGRDHNLTYMENTRCQTCHNVQFASFSQGHPDLGPVQRLGRGVQFDHAEHKQVFAEGEFACAGCHVSDAGGRNMNTKPFVQSCTGCHSQGKADYHRYAIRRNDTIILQVPEMEFDDDIYWPDAPGETLAPMMWLLLAGDDEALGALGSLYDFEEQKLDAIPFEWEPDDEELKIRLASAIKRLLHELVAKDDNARRERIAKAFGANPDDQYVTALAEQLASGTFAALAYQQRWLPGLADDLSGRGVETPVEAKGADWKPPRHKSGWYIDPGDVAIRYRPTGHSDTLLKNWIDALATYVEVTPDDKQHEGRDTSILSDETNVERDAAFRRSLRTHLFETLISKGGFLHNTCLECHAIEPSGRTHQVNWSFSGSESQESGYSKFNHLTHFAVYTDEGSCNQCHELAGQTANASDHPLAHGFLRHSKNQCDSCHAPKRAEDNCLTCHNYHMTRPGTPSQG